MHAHANMKTLVVYYSLSGNNRLLAETLSKRLDCESCELHPRKSRTKLDLVLDSFLYRTPPNQRIAFDIGAYDLVILVAPIWNARVAAPMRSFARQFGGHLRNYAFISACGGRRGQTTRLRSELNRFIGRGPKQLVELDAQQLLPPAMRKGLSASDYRFSPQDMVTLAPQLDRFLEAIGEDAAVNAARPNQRELSGPEAARDRPQNLHL